MRPTRRAQPYRKGVNLGDVGLLQTMQRGRANNLPNAADARRAVMKRARLAQLVAALQGGGSRSLKAGGHPSRGNPSIGGNRPGPQPPYRTLPYRRRHEDGSPTSRRRRLPSQYGSWRNRPYRA